MDILSSLDTVQEAIVIAKPRDVFGFIIRYYQDEKDNNNQTMNGSSSVISYCTEDLHAIHMLPFLIQNHIEFQNKASIIFCNQINNNEIYVKDYIDHAVVLDILKRINLEAFKLKVKAIDEFVTQRMIGLKKVYFDVFVSCLRLPLACYQIVIWLKDEISYHMNSDQTSMNIKESSPSKSVNSTNNNNTKTESSDNSTVSNTTITNYIGFLQSQATENVNLESLKVCLQRHPLLQVPIAKTAAAAANTTTTSNDRNRKVKVSCSYHMSSSSASTYLLLPTQEENDVTAVNNPIILLLQLLRSIVTHLLEPSITSLQSDTHKYIQTKDLIEEFMSQYLQQRQHSDNPSSVVLRTTRSSSS